MIKKAKREDLPLLAGLAAILWEHHTMEELSEEFSEIMDNGASQFFLFIDQEIPAGFAQCQLRHDYVEGTSTSPVGYLEGIFVREEYRHRGYGRELLKACELWAREQGCREFASDCELDNSGSLQFHLGAGFQEANRIICFTKKL